MIYLCLILVGFAICLAFGAFAAAGYNGKLLATLERRVTTLEVKQGGAGGGGAPAHVDKPSTLDASVLDRRHMLN